MGLGKTKLDQNQLCFPKYRDVIYCSLVVNCEMTGPQFQTKKTVHHPLLCVYLVINKPIVPHVMYLPFRDLVDIISPMMSSYISIPRFLLPPRLLLIPPSSTYFPRDSCILGFSMPALHPRCLEVFPSLPRRAVRLWRAENQTDFLLCFTEGGEC